FPLFEYGEDLVWSNGFVSAFRVICELADSVSPLVCPFLGCSEVGLCPEGVVFHVVGATALGARLGLGSVGAGDGSNALNLGVAGWAAVPVPLRLGLPCPPLIDGDGAAAADAHLGHQLIKGPSLAVAVPDGFRPGCDTVGVFQVVNAPGDQFAQVIALRTARRGSQP